MVKPLGSMRDGCSCTVDSYLNGASSMSYPARGSRPEMFRVYPLADLINRANVVRPNHGSGKNDSDIVPREGMLTWRAMG